MPSSRRRRRREPAPIRSLIGSALPKPLQKRMLGLDLLRDAWREAAPDAMLLEFEPVAFERGVLTLRAPDRRRARMTRQEREALAARLREAAGLPLAPLRIRIVGEA